MVETRDPPPRAQRPRRQETALDPASEEIREKTLKGGAITMAGQAMKLVLTVGSTAALARLLPPGDFGLMGMVSVVVGFLIAVGDMGLSIAIVQRAGLQRAQIDKLFWIGLAIQVGLATATALSAPLLGALFGEPAVVPMTIVMSVGFVIAGLGMTQLAVLRRQMRFAAVTGVEISSLVGGITFGVLAAAAGWGPWSLVAMYLGQRSLETLLAWFVCEWRPSRPRRDVRVGELLRFGGYHTGFAFVNYFARNSDNLLIGWFWGASPLGLYSRAYSLLMMPLVQLNVPITGVALPALSRMQDDPDRFRRIYLRALALLTTLGFPLVTFTILAASDIVSVFLGPQWTDVVDIFRALGIVGLAQLVTNTAGMLFVATGRTDRMFRLGVWSTIATLATFVMALPHGIDVLAISFATFTWISVLPILWTATLETPVHVLDIVKATARPALCALCVAGVLTITQPLLGGQAPIARLAVLATITGLTWLAFVHFVAREINPLRLLGELRRKEA